MSSGQPHTVTLYGTLVREQDGQLLFRVHAGLGDAAVCGFRRTGEIWIKRAQCSDVREAQRAGELDQIELSVSLAVQKAEALRERQGC